jgi:hypothetical protein
MTTFKNDKKTKKSGTTIETSTTEFNHRASFGRANSGEDITNIIRKIKLNDYNREKKEYMKRKNRELMKSSNG